MNQTIEGLKLYSRVLTYTDREYRADFVHGVTICSSADVGILRFGVFHQELSSDKLYEGLHPPGTATDTHELKDTFTHRISVKPRKIRCQIILE